MESRPATDDADQRTVTRYAVALLLTVASMALRQALEPILQGQTPLMALLVAPVLAAWYGGLGPGVLALCLCALGGQFLFMSPRYSLAGGPDDWLRVLLFLGVGALSAWLIASRRQALDQLQGEHRRLLATQAQLRRLFETNLLGIMYWTPERRVREANDELLRIWGRDRTALERQDLQLAELTPPEFAERDQRALVELRRSGRVAPLEKQYLRPDGSRVWVLVGSALTEEGGGVSFVLDITARKQAEIALHDANRRKDEFIAVLAHELRNPLAPVRHAVEILKRLGAPDPRLERARAVIDRQVSHMARLIDDLLDVGRIARGKLSLRMETCDFAAIARQTADDYRASLEAAGQRLRVHGADGPAWVEGDPVRLAQMLGNLLTNAERFNSQAGSVDVCTEIDHARGQVRVTVADTGIGMDEELLGRLFHPFAQAAQDLARSKGGLGLGLALTRGLAELHGGSISAHSDGPGRGSRFTLMLPLMRGAGPQANSCEMSLRV